MSKTWLQDEPEKKQALKDFLDSQADRFNQVDFIEADPISIPHRYSLKQDREIAGFWTAVLSWGQRKTILKKSAELMNLMDDSPHDFIVNHRVTDRRRFERFVHRTFQPADSLYFLEFLQSYYRNHDSLEDAFFSSSPHNVESALSRFHEYFFAAGNHLKRTKKHIASPRKNSSCKRLNMFLRWMVRNDNRGVDFGIWKNCRPADLMIPMDVHVFNVSHKLGLLDRVKPDWRAVKELTQRLRCLDSDDPVRYDYALFGLGVMKKSELPLNDLV